MSGYFARWLYPECPDTFFAAKAVPFQVETARNAFVDSYAAIGSGLTRLFPNLVPLLLLGLAGSSVWAQGVAPQGEPGAEGVEREADPLGESADGGETGAADESFEVMGQTADTDAFGPAVDDPFEDTDVSRPVNPDLNRDQENAPLETYTDDYTPLPVGRNELVTGGPGQGLSLRPEGVPLGRGVQLAHWLQLRAVYRLAGIYDSNVNREEDDEDDDFEINNTVILSLTAQRERWSSTLRYALTARTFLDDSSNDSIDHRGTLSGVWTGDKLTLRLNGGVGYLNRPEDPELNRGEVERILIQGRASAEYQFNRLLGLLTELTVDSQLFQDSGVNQFDQLAWAANGFLTLSPNLPVSFLVGGGYRELLYLDDDTPNPDLTLVRALVGVEASFPGRLTASVRAGYEVSDIKERRQFTGDAPEGLVLNGNIAWTIVDGSRLSLEFSRQIQLAVTAAARTVTRVGANFTQELPANVELFLNAVYEDQDREEQPDIRALRGGGGMTWTPVLWLQLGWQVDYQQRRSSAGDFDVLRAGVNITFRL